MSTLRIELDQDTDEALTALAEARGTAPADLAAEIVARYMKNVEGAPANENLASGTADADPLDALVGKYLGRQLDRDSQGNSIRRRDPLDAIVGSVDADPVDDIDEVIYGR